MIEDFFLLHVVTLSRAAVVVYLALAVIVGWVLRSVSDRRRWHFFWKHPGEIVKIPRYRGTAAGHSYVEYVPELENQTPNVRTSTGYEAYYRNQETKVMQPTSQHYTSQEITGVKSAKKDDLTVIEGIGPKIEKILNNAGITSWYQLAHTPTSEIKYLLEQAGNPFDTHDPTTWSHQASLAEKDAWTELEKYQKILKGGRIS